MSKELLLAHIVLEALSLGISVQLFWLAECLSMNEMQVTAFNFFYIYKRSTRGCLEGGASAIFLQPLASLEWSHCCLRQQTASSTRKFISILADTVLVSSWHCHLRYWFCSLNYPDVCHFVCFIHNSVQWQLIGKAACTPALFHWNSDDKTFCHVSK